jgi:hypothetical protein
MTEEDIEIRVERMVDRLDARFMAGEFEQEEYDAQYKQINEWAKARYKEMEIMN